MLNQWQLVFRTFTMCSLPWFVSCWFEIENPFLIPVAMLENCVNLRNIRIVPVLQLVIYQYMRHPSGRNLPYLQDTLQNEIRPQ